MQEKLYGLMLEGDGIVNRAAKEPSKKLVSEWLIEVYLNVPAQMVRNTLMKTGFEWFYLR